MRRREQSTLPSPPLKLDSSLVGTRCWDDREVCSVREPCEWEHAHIRHDPLLVCLEPLVYFRVFELEDLLREERAGARGRNP